MNTSTKRVDSKVQTDLSISLGLSAMIIFFIASGFISYSKISILSQNAQLVSHTHDVITSLGDLLSVVKDAETGQRGYVLTGSDRYLAPYNQAVANVQQQVASIESLVQDNPSQLAKIPSVKKNVAAKLAELDETVQLRHNQGFEAALAVVATDRGREVMDQLRSDIGGMQAQEYALRKSRIAERDVAYSTAMVTGLLTSLLGVLLSGIVAYLINRSASLRRREEWLQSGQAGLGSAMFGDQRIEQIGESILKFLSEYFDAQAGAFFFKEGSIFRRGATYGVPDNDASVPKQFTLGHGLLGQAAKDGKSFLLHDVPEGYLSVGSALGHSKPRHLIVAPASMDGHVNAVIELGFLHPLDEISIELLDRVSETIGVAVRSANYRSHLQNLLEETQRQAEEMQAQGEELRVSNEELEEQSRALKESQTRLEQQQAELEQTNSQLEEQTQILETQRDDLARAKASVQMKARELEQASQYKSDFLANMSHELRTPLNSSLILAKLLADNSGGNLTAEQVKFAQTIQSSGNDLLALINDILDLSKIEAGHMDIRPESVPVERLVSDLARVFEPMTKQKGLTFKTNIDPNCPKMIETDRQRLEQVLKNLLSNAIKFTQKGSVELTINMAGPGQIALAVNDTGIGIAPENQQAIFDAFRQADGTISRRYGGTGLGLSISRQLVRLLGGQIDLTSEHGKGSQFTVTIPAVYKAEFVAPLAPLASSYSAPAHSSAETTAPSSFHHPSIADDRGELVQSKRTILIVEDDIPFARILYDLVRELGFQCLIASTAEEATIVAKQYLPHAVVLDVGLPDNSGLSVLDRLKRNTRTRHIPVHVISANDYTETALSLGAIGYMVKPVKRDELVDALSRLETKLSQQMRRVLIVEDDAVQRDSMKRLLGSHDVETVAVGTVADSLQQLESSTFDCMVLDLSLPDASGYSLLETLSQEDAYSFPPVIVYTGHDLSADEEQRLRRYSKSIIIKGAKSPERLLDEVTLFLHQVVEKLPPEQQEMLQKASNRDAVLENRHILVVEDDIRNVYALTSILEPLGAIVHIARNGVEALDTLEEKMSDNDKPIDLILMDVMMPEMDGLTCTREIRKRPTWKKLPIITLTAKAMKDDQERCLEAGANDYIAKPLDVEKLLSLVRVWMPRR